MEFILANSLSIFWLSLALSVLVFTFFLIWALYYVIRILKNTNSIIERITNTLEKIDDILQIVRDKLNSTGVYFAAGMQALQKIMEFIHDVNKKSKRKRKN